MAFLDGDEWKVLSFAIRRTKGFNKTSDNISMSQFSNGTVKGGEQKDYGTGIGVGKIRKSLITLVESGLMIKVSENDPIENSGAEWALQINWDNVNLGILQIRYAEKSKKNAEKMTKIRSKKKINTPYCGTTPPIVAQHDPPIVAQHDPPIVAQPHNRKGKTEKERKQGAKKQKPPKRVPATIEEAVYSGQDVPEGLVGDSEKAKEEQFRRDAENAAWIICQGQPHLDPLAMAFMMARQIILPYDKKSQGGHRKALKAMYEAKPHGVRAEHVKTAVETMLAIPLMVKDLFSVQGFAIEAANPPPESEEEKDKFATL